MVDMLFSLYSDASGHGPHRQGWRPPDCSWLLRRFYTAAGMLLQVDVPAADFFPAMDRFFTQVRCFCCAARELLSLSAAVCRQMDVCAAGDSLLCVTDEAAPTFYIAKHVTDDPAVGRDIGSLQSLWRASEQTPENVLMDVGPLGAGEDRYHLFRIVGRPYALSAKVLAGLNSTQKRQIINGIVGSIYTLHHFMPPLPHRGLRPGCYYVCRQGSELPRCAGAVLDDKGQYSGKKTVYGELNSLFTERDRPYVHRAGAFGRRSARGADQGGHLLAGAAHRLCLHRPATRRPGRSAHPLRHGGAGAKADRPRPRGGRTSTRCGRDWKTAASALSTLRRPAKEPAPAGGCAVG